MTTVASQSILPEFIKLRWLEPYVTSGLNRKTFKSLPRGVYNGFVVKAGPGPLQITVAHDDPAGWQQGTGFQGGAFDSASGWSIAVHENTQGFNTTVAIQAGPGRNYVFDVSAHAGETVYPVIDVQYLQGQNTQAQVKLVDAPELESSPALLVLARVDVPSSGPVSSVNIRKDDPQYPRVRPFATEKKYGFMSQDQVMQLDWLSQVSASPAFSYETEIIVDGPQYVGLPTGYTYVVGADDLWVFKNGRKLFKGSSRDYLEVDRGDGRGEQVQVLQPSLRIGDRVEFRIQKYAAVTSSTTAVLDAGALIEQSLRELNFEGTGVTVFPDGPGRARVVIPGGGGSGGVVKSKVTAAPIVIFRALTLLADNTVDYLDPTDLDQNFYGVSIQSGSTGGIINVQGAGILAGAAGAVLGGGAIGDKVYVAQDGTGQLTTVAPDPEAGAIFQVGILDGANAVTGGSPIDIVFDRGRLA